MALIHRELIVGDAIGEVPDDAPQVPLARDLAAQQRRVRLKPAADQPDGRARRAHTQRPGPVASCCTGSRALGVPWGSVEEGRGTSGTFRETWRLLWEPESTIRVIELSAHGTTVQAAATHRLLERAASVEALADLVAVLDLALLADLPAVVQPVVARVEAQPPTIPTSCRSSTRSVRSPGRCVTAMCAAPTPRSANSVRRAGGPCRRRGGHGLPLTRRCCGGGDGRAAGRRAGRIGAGRSPGAPRRVAGRADRGGRAQRCARSGAGPRHPAVARRRHVEPGDGGARLSRALSVGTAPAVGAAFVEGFLAGSGTVLVHDGELLDVIDGWVSSLAPDAFLATAPLLRRTFGAFEPAERRQLGLLIADEARRRGRGSAPMCTGTCRRSARHGAPTAGCAGRRCRVR